MGEKRRHFSREYKRDAVQLVTFWRRKFLAGGDKAFIGKSRVTAEEAQMKELQKELEKVKEERDILKEALVVLSKRST